MVEEIKALAVSPTEQERAALMENLQPETLQRIAELQWMKARERLMWYIVDALEKAKPTGKMGDIKAALDAFKEITRLCGQTPVSADKTEPRADGKRLERAASRLLQAAGVNRVVPARESPPR